MANNQLSAAFLETIQGLKGEELTSGVLKYLLLHSKNCYKSFLELLELTPSPKHESPLDVQLEWATTWSHNTNGIPISGRLDLLIDTGEGLIGVENKIWAPFMENQPLKYCSKLLEAAQKRYSNRSGNVTLVILAPAAKKSEAEDKLETIRKRHGFEAIETKVVLWSELLKKFESVIEDSMYLKFVFEELNKFVNGRVWFSEPFSTIVPQLSGSTGGWNDYQKKLIGYLWYVFPDSGKRLNETNRWLGYAFHSNRMETWAWYGFVTSSELTPTSNGRKLDDVEFAINYGVADDSIALSQDTYTPVTFTTKSWYHRNGWAVNIQKDWDTFLKWSEVLEPAINAIYQESAGRADNRGPHLDPQGRDE